MFGNRWIGDLDDESIMAHRLQPALPSQVRPEQGHPVLVESCQNVGTGQTESAMQCAQDVTQLVCVIDLLR